MKFIHTGDIHWGMCPDANKPWGKERAQAIKDTFRIIIEKADKIPFLTSLFCISSLKQKSTVGNMIKLSFCSDN